MQNTIKDFVMVCKDCGPTSQTKLDGRPNGYIISCLKCGKNEQVLATETEVQTITPQELQGVN